VDEPNRIRKYAHQKIQNRSGRNGTGTFRRFQETASDQPSKFRIDFSSVDGDFIISADQNQVEVIIKI